VKFELTEKSKEFDQLREKFSPQDVELIRIKIQEEMELRFVGKIEEAQGETELYKNQASTIRRELEKTRSTMAIKEAVYQRDYEAVIVEKDEVIMQLRHNLSVLENEKMFPDQVESTRSLKLQIDELRSTVSHLQVEAQILTADKISLSNALEESRSVVEQSKASHREKISAVESSRVDTDLQIKLLQSDLIAKESSLLATQKELESLVLDDSRKRTLIQSLESTLADKSTTIYGARNEENKRLQIENTRLVSDVNRLMGVVTHLEETVRKSQKDHSELQSFIERNDIKTRKTHQNEVQKLSDRILQDEIYLATRDSDVRSLQVRYNKLNESYSIDIDVLKSEIVKLKRENSLLKNSRLYTKGEEAAATGGGGGGSQ